MSIKVGTLLAIILVSGTIILSGCGVSAADSAQSLAATTIPAAPATPQPETTAPPPAPATTVAPAETTAATTEAAPTTTAPTTTAAPTPEPIPGGGDFVIVARESEARYDISEWFEGETVTIYGTTSKISGSFSVLYADPAGATLAPIQLEAATFKGQGRHARSLRDSNINLLILKTFKYPCITFTPTALEGMPDHFTVGESYDFKVIGDMTIRDTTHQETFDATLTVTSEDRLEASITTTISRETYSLISFKIPSTVKDIADEVTLTVNFVAATQ